MALYVIGSLKDHITPEIAEHLSEALSAPYGVVYDVADAEYYLVEDEDK